MNRNPDLLEICACCIAKCLPHLCLDERELMMPYYRGLESIIACRQERKINVAVAKIADSRVRFGRISHAVSKARKVAIAHVAAVHNQWCEERGDSNPITSSNPI
jgi:hypothetical protein